MSLPHFFIDGPIADKAGDAVTLKLPGDVAGHLHTLRLRANEHLVFADAPGHGWEVELTAPLERRRGIAEGVLVREHTSDTARLPELTLVQGISATDRMDQTIRQTTELGIRRIIPLESERSTVRLDDEARAAKRRRWERVARGAAEQSGQLVLPAIEMPRALPEALALLVTLKCEGLVFFWEEPGGLSLGEALERLGVARERPATDGQLRLESRPVSQREAQSEPQPARQPRLAVFIGPEGGFSEAEATLIRAQGAQVATLGATILRTETAAVVACALILHQLGGLGAR